MIRLAIILTIGALAIGAVRLDRSLNRAFLGWL